MRFGFHSVAALAVITVAACQPAAIEDDFEKASYLIGLEVGSSLRQVGDHLDLEVFMKGVEDGRAEADLAVDLEELYAARDRVETVLQAEREARTAELSARNIEEGKAYLASNAEKDGVTVTESGLQYEVLREGDGVHPTGDQRVTVHYSGSLIDGTIFDSSYERDQPSRFPVSGVISGFEEGLRMMSVGAKYRLVIPSDLAYGEQQAGSKIGPNSTLIFEIEMLEIETEAEAAGN